MNRSDLIRALDDSEANELAVLVAQREEAKRRALEDPTPAKLDAQDKATRAVERFLSKSKGAGLILRTQVAAAAFLQERGFVVSKSKFHNDFKAGLISSNADGHFEEGPLLAYASAYLQAKARQERREAAEAKEGKLTAEQELKQVMAERHRVKLARERGEVILRSEHEEELAARAQFFKGDLMQFAVRVAPVAVAMVGGDESRLPELIRYLQEEILTAMDAYSRDREFVVAMQEPSDA